MPLYAYQCQECGLSFERRQSFNDDPIEVCPECGGPVQRLIQPVGIIFKGSGFYVTDNRAKSSTRIPTKSEKEKETTSESSSASDTKSDATTKSATSESTSAEKKDTKKT